MNSNKRNIKGKNPKFKGSNRKGKFKDVKDDFKGNPERTSDVVNDASYYINSNDSTLMEQLTNFSFDDFAGVPLDMGEIGSDKYVSELGNIAQIMVNPAAGFTAVEDGPAAGINLVALKTYTYLSATNAKTTNYGPQDVMLLILAIGDLLAQLSHGARALGLMYTYSQRNRSYPELLLAAAGFDIDDLKEHAAEYKTRYNYIITRINKIPIFADIKYFKKMSEMFHGVYLDEDGSGMAQSYVFVPYSHWVLDETSNPNGSILKGTVQKGFSQGAGNDGLFMQRYFNMYLDDLETMIAALLNSSTFNFIYADIKRLNEKENLNLLTLNAIPDNYTVLPQKVEELSAWVNNMMVIGEPELNPVNMSATYTFTPGNDVETDANTNAIIYRPQFRTDIDESGLEPIVNFKYERPTIDDKIYAVMLHNQKKVFQASGETFFRSYKVSLCDWYVVQYNVVSYKGGGYVNAPKSIIPNTSWGPGLTAPISKFDWHPYWYLVHSGSKKVYIIGDTQYFTNINFNTLFRIHEVMFMEEISLLK